MARCVAAICLAVVMSVGATATVSAEGDLPIGLTWNPTQPEIGEGVVLNVTGIAIPVRAEWDFGENGCVGFPRYVTCESTFNRCHEILFRFASAGEKTISAAVRDPASGLLLGTAQANVTVASSGWCQAIDDEVLILQSMHADGPTNTLWRHEMEVFNPAPVCASLRIDWLPFGSNNAPPPNSALVEIPGDSAVRFPNTLFDVFGLSTNYLGSLRIEPLQGSLRFSNFGLNSGVDGSWGWTIPTIRRADALTTGEVGSIINVGQNVDIRSGIHCGNFNENPVQIHMDLFDSTGVPLDRIDMDLEPLGNGRHLQVFDDFDPVEGYLLVSTETFGAEFTCAARVNYNHSDEDARIEFLHAPGRLATVSYLPRAIHSDVSTTDLSLFAPDGNATARIDLLPTDRDNTIPQSSMVFSIPAGTERRFRSVLDTVFAFEGTAALRVTATNGAIAVSAREVATPPGFKRHWAVRPHAMEGATPAGGTSAIIHLSESADHQSDIGVVNTSAVTIEVLIDLRDQDGHFLGARILELLPFSHHQIDAILGAIGHPDTPEAIARLSTATPGGSFVTYALVTELATRDAWMLSSSAVSAPPFADDFEFGTTERWSVTVSE